MARIRAAGVPAPAHRHRDHDHVQDQEDRPRAAGLRSAHRQRSDLCQRSRRQGVRSHRHAALRADRRKAGAAVSAVTNQVDAADVLAFWRAAGPDKWFKKDTAFDAEIAQRFSALWQQAAAGALPAWEGTAEAALSLVILLDQFPRNMFRGDARAFATDAAARAIAERAIARGFDQAVPASERLFFYLPFEHSESEADQARAIALVDALGDPDLTR